MKKKTTLFTLAIAAALFAATFATVIVRSPKTDALSGNQFNAGHIIDDVIFTNSNAMSVNDIQNFLNAKVPTCDTNGTQTSSHWNSSAGRYYTRAEWGAVSGNPAPYTCLKDYRENITNNQNNIGNPSANIAGSESAAQIIYNAAQAYQINPQVILTTLQKEQGIVTDDWPWTSEYTHAMGYACPDSGGCNAANSGFYKQVDGAAWQFRHYLNNPNSYNYWVGNYYVQYNPSSSCGGSVINIQNAATAALYIYTPYQPNAAALNNLTGTGDSCSAYGNRNFWYYFNSWFGTSLASGYAWQPLQQAVFTDSSMTTALDPNNLLPGQKFYVYLKGENTGSVTWTKGTYGRQVNIGTTHWMDRGSWFCDPSTWLSTSCNRPATANEASVAPGQNATFGFWAIAPPAGTYNEYFNLVMDGSSWMSNDPGLYWTFRVKAPSWQPTQQTTFTDSSMATPVDPTNLIPGQKFWVQLKATNTGTTTWQKGVAGQQMNLGTMSPRDRGSWFCDPTTWLSTSCNRPATAAESTVAPGQTGTFGFWAIAPPAGTYNEYFNLVMDGSSWAANDPGLYWTFKVNPVSPTWKPVQQSMYTDSSMATAQDPTNLLPNHRYYLLIKAQNTGNVTWQKGVANRQMNLGTSHAQDRASAFCDSSWTNSTCNRPATAAESTVAPGQTGTFGFWITTPASTGTYNEYFNLVMDGTGWAPNDPGLYWTFKVH